MSPLITGVSGDPIFVQVLNATWDLIAEITFWGALTHLWPHSSGRDDVTSFFEWGFRTLRPLSHCHFGDISHLHIHNLWLLWCYLTGSDLTHDDRKHLHGLPFTAVDFGPLPPARVRVELDLCEADRWYRHSILRGGKGWFWGWEVGHLIQSLCWFPLYDGRQGRRQRGQRRQRGRGLLELTAGLDAVPQLGFAGFLPASQASEHAAVQQQHDGTGDKEGAHWGVQDVVIVLEFALSGVAARHVVDAKYDGGRHRQGQDPSGRQQHGLSQVHMFPVVVEWY